MIYNTFQTQSARLLRNIKMEPPLDCDVCARCNRLRRLSYPQTWYRLLDLGGDTLCTPDSATWRPSTPFLATAYRGNCSFVDKVDNARSLGASGLLVVFLDGQDLVGEFTLSLSYGPRSVINHRTREIFYSVGCFISGY